MENENKNLSKEEIRNSISALYNFGYESDIESFIIALNQLQKAALQREYNDNPENWSSILERKVRILLKMDSLAYKVLKTHIFRTVNICDKADMLEFVKEINNIFWLN